VTGTAHSRQFYLDANAPWTATPSGSFPDWYEWRKLMRAPHFSGATSTRVTALQFPSSQDGRDGWSARRRLDELESWAALAATQNGQALIDELVARGDRMTVAEQHRALTDARGWAERRSVRMVDNLARLVRRLPAVRRSGHR
jgi:hypothetical protein